MRQFYVKPPEPTTGKIEQIAFEGLDGIEVKGTAEYSYYELPGQIGITMMLGFRNTSAAAVSKITWRGEFIGPQGNVIDFTEQDWEGYDIPMAPGETGGVRGYRGIQSDTVPEELSVKIRVTRVYTVEEIPPVHRPEAGEYLYQALSNDHLARIKEEPPVSVRLTIDRGGARAIADVTDENIIRALVEAFTRVRIRNDQGRFITDNYNSVRFKFADGEEAGFSLFLKTLGLHMRNGLVCYELDDFGPFWMMMGELCEAARQERSSRMRGRF